MRQAMASQSEQKILEFPPNFYVGHMIGRKGNTKRYIYFSIEPFYNFLLYLGAVSSIHGGL